ncbi:MAG: preprotein translocase subunit YajC [Lachnospiraceae bacterium]|nr:preprotein translocase subunit YajC [Lachnospiraceae bacterium]
MFNLLLDAAANANGGGGFLGGLGIWGTVLYIAIFGVFIYFVIVRPQKKEQKKIQAMLSNMEVGDAVVTTSGFYGVIIDITDEDVIVEFGNNKNCRIPMKKSAIAQIEKAE